MAPFLDMDDVRLPPPPRARVECNQSETPSESKSHLGKIFVMACDDVESSGETRPSNGRNMQMAVDVRVGIDMAFAGRPCWQTEERRSRAVFADRADGNAEPAGLVGEIGRG